MLPLGADEPCEAVGIGVPCGLPSLYDPEGRVRTKVRQAAGEELTVHGLVGVEQQHVRGLDVLPRGVEVAGLRARGSLDDGDLLRVFVPIFVGDRDGVVGRLRGGNQEHGNVLERLEVVIEALR